MYHVIYPIVTYYIKWRSYACHVSIARLCKVTLPVPDFPSFGSLQLFLSDSHATDDIVTCCKNLRILNIMLGVPDIRVFVDGIMERKNLILLEKVFWKDVVVMCCSDVLSERMLHVHVSFRW
jgi:hypothetical protein